MRSSSPTFHCHFCGDIPRQMLTYSGVVGKWPNPARHYRCGICESFVFAERVTQKEIGVGEIDDTEFPTDGYYELSQIRMQ